MEDKLVKCDRCGETYGIGDYPFCNGKPNAHGKPECFEEPLTPYYDENLEAYITTRAERRKIMAEQGVDYYTSRARKKAGRLYFFT